MSVIAFSLELSHWHSFSLKIADCCLEVSSEIKWFRCPGYKTGFIFHCFVPVFPQIFSYLASNIRAEKDCGCLC